MGIGTLRRHYEAEGAADNAAPSTPQPVVEQHAEGTEAVNIPSLLRDIDRLTSANASLIEQAQHWKAEAVALGWEKPASEPVEDATPPALHDAADGEEDAAEGEQDKADDEGTTPEDAPEPDYPARSAKTAEWVTFAEEHPTDPPLDLTPRTGLRDAIAAHYLGE